MNMADTIFLVQLILFTGAFFLKVYNVMTVGEFYSGKMAFMSFIGSLLLYGLGLVLLLYDPAEKIIITLFTLQTWLFLMTIFLTIAETLIYAGKEITDKPGFKTLGSLKGD